MATPEEVVEQLGAKIARQAARIAELEKKLAAKKAECEALRDDSKILAAVRKEWTEAHEIMGFHPKGPLVAMEEARDTECARAEKAEARCEALEACLGLCRQCRYPGTTCKDCPNDAALRAVEG